MTNPRSWLAAVALVFAAAGAAAQVTPTPVAPAATTAPAAAAPAAAPSAAAVPAPVSEAAKALRARLDADKLDLDQREAALGRRDLTGTDLTRLRDGLDGIADRLRVATDGLTPRIDAAKARLEQLGPKPKEGTAEGADVARERAEREAAVAEVDETQRLGRSLLLQSDQIADQISNRRRGVFARALFERNSSILSPELWTRTIADLPRDLRALGVVFADAFARMQRGANLTSLTLIGVAFGGALALYFGRRNIAPRFGRRDETVLAPPARGKLMAAWRVLAVGAVPACLGSYAVYAAIDATDLLSARLSPIANAILLGLAFVAFVEALTDALLAPAKPSWRLVQMSDAGATRVVTLAVGASVIVTIGKVIEALNQSIAAALPVTIATRGLFALLAALVLAEGLRRFAVTETNEEDCLGPYIPTDTGSGGGPLRILGWAAGAAVVISAVTGYVALASFLVDQLVWVAILAAILYLAAVSADGFVGGTLKDETRLATALQANTGLRRRSLNQIAVLATGLIRAFLYVAAAFLVLAPWGLDSADLLSSLRAAFFGFRVGDVTVSLSTIAIALTIFAVGFVVARAVQRWLENTFLPATELDAGLRNSIATATGYLGVIVALAASFSYLGLSLDRIAIVAGALSVGIGFGLQSIINNFVSGLILLWERPIRVGDLVVVAESEGYVRRISVRATEIQTFDRSTTIVPNSNLISGIVKNRVRGDRTGRVTLTVSVLRNQDPVRAAEIIAGCARRHPDVLKEPPPRVLFRKIGDPSLEFELLAYVADVNLQASVQSDLNYAVFQSLSEQSLIPALGPGSSVVTVHGLEPVQSALGEIATAMGQGALRAAQAMRPEAVDEEPAPARRRPAKVSS